MSSGGSSFSKHVSRGLCVLALAAGSVAAVAAGAAESPMTLVLAGGGTVEVAAARVQGDMVIVTRLDGLQVPVPVSSVALGASGLEPTAPDRRLASGRALVDMESMGTSGIDQPAITDATVGHVDRDRDPAVPGVGPTPGSGEPGIRVSGVNHVMSGSRATVSGTVTNTTGAPVDGLTIEVTALAADRTQLGHASTIVGPLTPGASWRFAVPVNVNATPAAIRVFVNAPVDRVLFEVD